ncbi:MAG: capsule assembly Wzi family protein [Pseudomonadota bacterium]
MDYPTPHASSVISNSMFMLMAIGLMMCNSAIANTWLDPGDIQVRHDIQWLSDAGILPVPVTTWPLSWDDLVPGIETPLSDPVLEHARQRVRNHYRRTSHEKHLGINLSSDPQIYRTFESTPREKHSVEGLIQSFDNPLTYRLQIHLVDDPSDHRKIRLDGSYLATELGNWTVSAGALDRWWGPGWDGSLILSNNARPIPGIQVQRRTSHPFSTKWLSWAGPWQLVFNLGELEANRDVPNALFMGLRVNFKPINHLELGFSRTALWGGEDRPADFETFINLVLGRDNTGDNGITSANEPGNQLAGMDARWTSHLFDVPYAVYGQLIGEDAAGYGPSKYIGLFGIESFGSGAMAGSAYHTHLEYADTTVRFYDSNPEYNVAYTHSTYKSGYTYRGRTIGHALGGDGRMISFGAQYLYNDTKLSNLLIRYIIPDRDSPTAEKIVSLEASHRHPWHKHRFTFRIGGQWTKYKPDNNSDRDGYFEIMWGYDI